MACSGSWLQRTGTSAARKFYKVCASLHGRLPSALFLHFSVRQLFCASLLGPEIHICAAAASAFSARANRGPRLLSYGLRARAGALASLTPRGARRGRFRGSQVELCNVTKSFTLFKMQKRNFEITDKSHRARFSRAAVALALFMAGSVEAQDCAAGEFSANGTCTLCSAGLFRCFVGAQNKTLRLYSLKPRG